LIGIRNSRIGTQRDIADELNRYFGSIFTKEDRENVPVKELETDQRLDQITVTREIVLRKLQKLRPDSAAGPDGIHP
jgi:hypothetical protein